MRDGRGGGGGRVLPRAFRARHQKGKKEVGRKAYCVADTVVHGYTAEGISGKFCYHSKNRT